MVFYQIVTKILNFLMNVGTVPRFVISAAFLYHNKWCGPMKNFILQIKRQALDFC